ncbi:MAG: hypothetical protein U9N33_08230, partial [Campylobacterota bacterium]|nr:hypothetical protein [Campylobacterota bacterium]
MTKVLLPLYALKTEDRSIKIYRNNKIVAHTSQGIKEALQAIFVLEDYTDSNWLIYEDEKVYLVDRAKYQRDKEFNNEL